METIDLKIALGVAVFGMVPVMATEGLTSWVLLGVQISALAYMIYQGRVNGRAWCD